MLLERCTVFSSSFFDSACFNDSLVSWSVALFIFSSIIEHSGFSVSPILPRVPERCIEITIKDVTESSKSNNVILIGFIIQPVKLALLSSSGKYTLDVSFKEKCDFLPL